MSLVSLHHDIYLESPFQNYALYQNIQRGVNPQVNPYFDYPAF